MLNRPQHYSINTVPAYPGDAAVVVGVEAVDGEVERLGLWAEERGRRGQEGGGGEGGWHGSVVEEERGVVRW